MNDLIINPYPIVVVLLVLARDELLDSADGLSHKQ
jgi:hypothetical protein